MPVEIIIGLAFVSWADKEIAAGYGISKNGMLGHVPLS